MDGILLIDKPKGWTSFDVVAKARGIIRNQIRNEHVARGFCMESQSAKQASNGANRTKRYDARVTEPGDKALVSKASLSDSSAGAWRCRCKVRVGHTGTLDPSATGLLVLCIGKYTKKVPEIIRHDKTYEVELTLGATSTTGDQEGQITTIKAVKPEETVVAEILNNFIGKQMQTPPAYSAIKIDGVRAYDLARAGKDVKLQPREVTIHSITDVDYSWPKLNFTVEVSSGTYIRSLAEDIGKKLGIGAYMSELRRTNIEKYSIKDAINAGMLDFEIINKSIKEI